MAAVRLRARTLAFGILASVGILVLALAIHVMVAGPSSPATAVGVSPSPSATLSPSASPTSTPRATAPALSGYALPDRTLTPGAVLSPNVAQVCTPGYARSVRSVSAEEKLQVEAEYHWTHRPGNGQEIDHLIPLELGGSNGITNLWPEPAPDFHVKDRLENALHGAVCGGTMQLADAQQCIAVNWVGCWRRMGEP